MLSLILFSITSSHINTLFQVHLKIVIRLDSFHPYLHNSFLNLIQAIISCWSQVIMGPNLLHPKLYSLFHKFVIKIKHNACVCFRKCIVYAKEIIVETILKLKSFIIPHCLLRILNIKSTGTESYSITPFQVDTLYHILSYLFNHY